MHASTTHTSFYVNDLRKIRLPSQSNSESWITGTRSRKHRSSSFSSRVETNFVAYNADVNEVDIEEKCHLNNSDDAIIDSDDDEDAG